MAATTFQRPRSRPAPKLPAGKWTLKEISMPALFLCPISLELMRDPVTTSTGITYDRANIEAWLDKGNRVCPATNLSLPGDGGELVPNHAIRRMIQDWCVANRAHGVERIPTPRIPVTTAQAVEIAAEVAAAFRGGNFVRLRELMGIIRALAKESERNMSCFVSAGVGGVLAEAFRSFATSATATDILEDILSTLSGSLQLDEEPLRKLQSPESMSSLVSILKCGESACQINNNNNKMNAVLLIRKIVSSDKSTAAAAAGYGLVDELVKLVREPISPVATKAALVTAFYLLSSTGDNTVAARFVEAGAVALLLELLVDSDRSICEKALAVLDQILGHDGGREEAAGNALATPVIVKKMLRVSELATELAVSALWKLGGGKKKKMKTSTDEGEDEMGEECLVEALRYGAFQKLLLLLQVGCSDATKERATELLKMMNMHRERSECIDTVDFKVLKRPF